MPTRTTLDATLDAVVPTTSDGAGHPHLDRLDLAEWCLTAGRGRRNPLDGWGHLLVETTPVPMHRAA